MVRTGMALLGALLVLVIAAALIYVIRVQQQQAQDLARLMECVSILQRNQSTPESGLVMRCPIYD